MLNIQQKYEKYVHHTLIIPNNSLQLKIIPYI